MSKPRLFMYPKGYQYEQLDSFKTPNPMKRVRVGWEEWDLFSKAVNGFLADTNLLSNVSNNRVKHLVRFALEFPEEMVDPLDIFLVVDEFNRVSSSVKELTYE